ncbi:MAG: hypothetical protein QW057_04890, partial [Candidatus Bathyarchaeia archaeon]
VEPAVKQKLRLAIPISGRRGLDSRPARHFGALLYLTLIDIISEESFCGTEEEEGITTAMLLVKQSRCSAH